VLAKWWALAILFPFGSREELLAKRPAEEWDCSVIAMEVEIPESYVHVVLTPQWVSLREDIINFN
jgi:hypothetical protein